MKAILLGSLGVLADTSGLRRKAFGNAARDHGLRFDLTSDSYLNRLIRTPANSREDAGVTIESILQARDDYVSKGLAEGPIEARKGLRRLIATAGQQGLPLGLVATTPMPWTISVFDRLPLAPEIFDVIVSATDIAAPKPAPDCYHLAAAMLATAPEDCLVVEDSFAGVRAARAAGMEVLDLSPGAHVPADPLGDLERRLARQVLADQG